MRNVFDARVESCEPKDSCAWLRLGRGRLAARLWPGIRAGQKVRVSVRPEEVILCAEHPGRTSARNVLPGHVRRTRYIREGMEVELDVGFPLTAAITRKGAKEMGIRRGGALYALVKASSVHPHVEIGGRIRVALVGPKGRIDPSRMDLLRAVEREGSLSKAAAGIGITYRTAWLWAREINRAWGSPLLDRAHGGKGGGGTALTPAGLAALRRAAEIEGRATSSPRA